MASHSVTHRSPNFLSSFLGHLFLKLFALTILLGTATLVQGQSCFTQVGEADILCLAETYQFLFMGTEESGMLKYDKITEEMTEINTGNSDIESDKVISIVWHIGQIYFSTDSALYHYNMSTTQITTINDSISGVLAAGLGQRLLISGISDYYELIQGEIVYHQDLTDYVNFSCGICDRTTDVEVTDNGDVWISHFGFYEYDVLRYDGTEWTLYDITTHPELFPIESWADNRLDSKDGRLFSSSWGGLLIHEDESWEVIDSYSDPQVIDGLDTLLLGHTGLAFDQNQGYWFGTQRDWTIEGPARIAYFNTSDWQIIPLPADTSVDVTDVSASYIDSYIIYVTTNGGLFILNKECLGIVNSVSDLEPLDLGIYPNPSSGRIAFHEPMSGQLRIYDSLGSIVYRYTLDNSTSIDISQLPAGLYQVEVSGSKELWSSGLVVE